VARAGAPATLRNADTHCAFHARDETQVKRTRSLTTIDIATSFVSPHFPAQRNDHKNAANQGVGMRVAARVIVHVGERALM
jgi:hypothetical protein